VRSLATHEREAFEGKLIFFLSFSFPDSLSVSLSLSFSQTRSQVADANRPRCLPRVPHYSNICRTHHSCQMISHFQCHNNKNNSNNKKPATYFYATPEIKFVSITIALTYNLWASRISQQLLV